MSQIIQIYVYYIEVLFSHFIDIWKIHDMSF